MINVLGADTRIGNGVLHGLGHAFAAVQRGGHMKSVAGGTKAREFRVNFCAARLGAVQRFHKEHARTFAHDEAGAFFVKGARSFFRFVIAGGQGL